MNHPKRNRQNFTWAHQTYGSVCVYCGAHGNTVDHVIPWTFIQDQGRTNLVTACRVCNGIAGNLVFDSFDSKRAYVRNRRQELGYPMRVDQPESPVIPPLVILDDGQLPVLATNETEKMVTSIDRRLRDLEKLARDEDPWTLAEMIRLRNELDAMTVRTVARLRQVGYTWDAIGYNLKISGVTAHKRYARKIGA